VISAASKGVVGGCDTGMEAKVAYSSGTSGQQLVGTLEADLRHKGPFPVTMFTAEGTRGRVTIDNFVVPFFGHCITVSTAPTGVDGGMGGRPSSSTRTVSVYGTGETNYWYQLRRFVDDVTVLIRGSGGGAGGGQTEAGVLAAMRCDAQDAVANMALIDAIYQAAGLRPRQPAEAWY